MHSHVVNFGNYMETWLADPDEPMGTDEDRTRIHAILNAVGEVEVENAADDKDAFSKALEIALDGSGARGSDYQRLAGLARRELQRQYHSEDVAFNSVTEVNGRLSYITDAIRYYIDERGDANLSLEEFAGRHHINPDNSPTYRSILESGRDAVGVDKRMMLEDVSNGWSDAALANIRNHISEQRAKRDTPPEVEQLDMDVEIPDEPRLPL